MKTMEGLLSVRIVVADFYMQRPTPGLDPTYSDYRGHEIKNLPVIRIFGSNRDGEKICMHVHGVLPYFYIPYENDTTCGPDRFTYQLAASLDKAINISLNQSQSQNQHVFKIQLVKGIPFYGYHRKEHQFLKIFLYNPRFIKKAASLLQNGAILGKVFQPHESHVPYILQFFIDYNLYGMSFLHVPIEVVKYRQSDEYDVPVEIPREQILEQKIARLSTMRHEIDIAAAFILNRFQSLSQDSGNSNPGIEAIWQDERMRRKNVEEDMQMPPLEIPCSLERIAAKPTESDIFYKAALQVKLASEKEENSSFNSSSLEVSSSQRKKKFDLSKLLLNSVYPSECSQEMNATLANASRIPDHISNNSLFHSTLRGRSKSRSSVSTDKSFVDEEIVLSLSQSNQKSVLDQTLGAEDLELLEVMQQLEEDEGEIDLDSTLAPLSQSSTNAFKNICEDDNVKRDAEKTNETCSDDDADGMLDYTISLDSVDKILMELSQPKDPAVIEKFPQFDGGDDAFSTPKKRRTTRAALARLKSSPRSPRISRGSKYTPLNITINKSPNSKKLGLNENGEVNGGRRFAGNTGDQLENSMTPVNVRLKRILVNAFNETNQVARTDLTNSMPDEKSFLVCSLKPHVRVKDTLQIEHVENKQMKQDEEIVNKSSRLKKCKVNIKRLRFNETIATEKIETSEKLVEAKLDEEMHGLESTEDCEKCCTVEEIGHAVEDEKIENTNDNVLVNHVMLDTITEDAPIGNISLDANGFVKSEIRAVEVMNFRYNRRKSWSPCDISREYDRKNNYYPKPGPSGMKKRRRERKNKVEKTPLPKRVTRLMTKQEAANDTEVNCTDENGDGNEDLNICSFYEKSYLFESPSIFSDCGSPRTPKRIESSSESCLINTWQVQTIVPTTNSSLAVIAPSVLPPTFQDTEDTSVAFNIPDEVFTEPFYGDDADVTSKREIGHTVLQIPGKSLNACQDFESLLPCLKGIGAWRRNVFSSMVGETPKGNMHDNASIKEYLSSRERVIISTKNHPPTYKDAKQWLEVLTKAHKENVKQNNNEDSPIKVRTEKIKLILDESNFGDTNGDNLSQRSISLTPLTPDIKKNPAQSANIKSMNQKNATPLNVVAPPITTPLSALEKFRERRKSRARLSLAKKLQRLGSLDSPSSGTDTENVKLSTDTKQAITNVPPVQYPSSSDVVSEHSSGSGQTADSCNDKVKQILERTSFMRNISISDNGSDGDVSFGLSGATLDNTFGFKISLENLRNVKADVEHNHLTVFSLEIHVNTRGELKPDPQLDPVECIFFSISSDSQINMEASRSSVGCIQVCNGENPFLNGVNTNFVPVKSELELFDQLLQLFRRWDPDLLVGYEIEMNSWGYLMDRAQVLGMNLKALLSRVPTQKVRDTQGDEEKDTFIDFDIELKLCGRILLDVWRLMRSEIALTSYTFENVVYHILHRRCPSHTFRDLTRWYIPLKTRWIVLEYYLERINGTMELLEQLDLIGRTSEMAKLMGIQFYEVLSRGSQFRVESMMLRIAKPKNFVPVSPSVQQRAHARAPEYLPLILEPKSRFYADPIIVLDFQSLYPSMIIAYNYCFSTCLGRVEHLGKTTPFEFGSSQLRVSVSEIERLAHKDQITISPCGVVFVRKEIREGVLPRMLKEILDTRLMVKQSMKLHKTNSTLQRVLHSRQLGLKLMANVTYGYTAANFSGRMSCVELPIQLIGCLDLERKIQQPSSEAQWWLPKIYGSLVADSVVGKGRETLERAIKLVEANEKWRAKVVYGDTDSLFVLVPGRNRTEAFKIGEEIAEAVTNDNPQPVKLKLEKVYQPCILQTKKRYVGYMYESADQSEPIYEAKGIETVRRDGCPAVAKMLEKCLRILFETCDVSQIKRYVCRQFTKLLTGNANVQDLIFAKEFRGKNGYKPGACVPALELTRKWLQTDPRSEPRRGERVPFLIVNGPPGLPLIRLVRSPHEYLADEGLKINAIYYITKAIIPPLNRCLLLIGADVNDWFTELPRKHLALPVFSNTNSASVSLQQDTKKSTISQYFASSNCIIDCGRHTKAGICNICLRDTQKSVTILHQKIAKLERAYYLTEQICQSCCGRLENIECCSLDCPVLCVANFKKREQNQVQYFENIIKEKISKK